LVAVLLVKVACAQPAPRGVFSLARDLSLRCGKVRVSTGAAAPPPGAAPSEEPTANEIPANEIPGDAVIVLTLTLKSASDLMAADSNGLSDPFVKITIGGEDERKSKTMNETINPVWNDKFAFKGTKAALLAKAFAFRIFDSDGRGAKADKLGSAEMSLATMAASGAERQFSLSLADPKVKGSKGTLDISIRYDAFDVNGDDVPEFVEDPGVRWLCVREVDVSKNGIFATRCATEMGFLSATLSREVALQKARQTSPPAVVMRLQVSEELHERAVAQGSSIAAFSLTPEDHEIVYLPGALLQYQGVQVMQGNGDPQEGAEAKDMQKRDKDAPEDVHVVDVSPLLA